MLFWSQSMERTQTWYQAAIHERLQSQIKIQFNLKVLN